MIISYCEGINENGKTIGVCVRLHRRWSWPSRNAHNIFIDCGWIDVHYSRTFTFAISMFHFEGARTFFATLKLLFHVRPEEWTPMTWQNSSLYYRMICLYTRIKEFIWNIIRWNTKRHSIEFHRRIQSSHTHTHRRHQCLRRIIANLMRFCCCCSLTTLEMK